MHNDSIVTTPRRAMSARGAGRLAPCLAVSAALAAGPVLAQPPTSELGAYVTVATDARNHGLSQLHDGAAVRLGIDYQHARGFFAGGVLGNVGYAVEAGVPEPRDRLLELYTGYLWRAGDWGFTATAGHYRYPDTTYDYDYSELSFVVDFRDRYFYRVSYTDDMLAAGYSATQHELGVTAALPAALELGVSLGRLDRRGAAPAYTHYDIGLSRLVGRFGLDLRRYETSRDVVGLLGASDDRWVLSLSYAIRPRP